MSSRLTNLQNPKFLVSFHEVAGSLIGSRQVTDVPLKKLGGGTAQRCNLLEQLYDVSDGTFKFCHGMLPMWYEHLS